jgi:hypothetical protein
MPTYVFSLEKNLTLIEERSISFDEVIAAIENDQILDILEHPNKQKYGNQKMYVIWVKEYVYLVPFVIDTNGNIFLKTIIPSRKAKRKYIQGER